MKSPFKQNKIIAEMIRISDGQLLNYDGFVYKTTITLYNYGIMCCDDCGNMQPLEKKKCEACGNEIFIIKDTTTIKLKNHEQL
jgi:hypothetical protein